jgi:serine protease
VGLGVTVSPAIPWSSVPAPGHYCFVGVVGNALDPAPDPATLFDWTTYQQYLRQNNNVTWRNFNVV